MENLWLRMARFSLTLLLQISQKISVIQQTDLKPTLQSNVCSKPIEVNKTMTVKGQLI